MAAATESRRDQINRLVNIGVDVGRRKDGYKNRTAVSANGHGGGNGTAQIIEAQPSTAQLQHAIEDINIRQMGMNANLLTFALGRLKAEVGDAAYGKMPIEERVNMALYLFRAGAQARLQAEEVVTEAAMHDAMQAMLAQVPEEISRRHLLGKRLSRNPRLDQIVDQVSAMAIAVAANNTPGLVKGMEQWAQAAEIRAQGAESTARAVLQTQNIQDQVDENRRRLARDGQRENAKKWVDDALGTLVDKDRGVPVRAVDSLTNAGKKAAENLTVPAITGAGIGAGLMGLAATWGAVATRVEMSAIPEEIRPLALVSLALLVIGGAAGGGAIGKGIENRLKPKAPQAGHGHP